MAGGVGRVGGARPGGVAAALDLLDRARASLLQACQAGSTTDRYLAAHLGALRAAAAVLAARPDGGRATLPHRSVWAHLVALAPELAEWADYFAAAGVRRAAVEAGTVPTRREADDLLRAAETFLMLVAGALGLPVRFREGALAAVGGP